MYNRYLRNSEYEHGLPPREIIHEDTREEVFEEAHEVFGPSSHRQEKRGLLDLFNGHDFKLSLDIIDLCILGIFLFLYIESNDDELLIAMVILVVLTLLE